MVEVILHCLRLFTYGSVFDKSWPRRLRVKLLSLSASGPPPARLPSPASTVGSQCSWKPKASKSMSESIPVSAMGGPAFHRRQALASAPQASSRRDQMVDYNGSGCGDKDRGGGGTTSLEQPTVNI